MFVISHKGSNTVEIALMLEIGNLCQTMNESTVMENHISQENVYN